MVLNYLIYQIKFCFVFYVKDKNLFRTISDCSLLCVNAFACSEKFAISKIV